MAPTAHTFAGSAELVNVGAAVGPPSPLNKQQKSLGRAQVATGASTMREVQEQGPERRRRHRHRKAQMRRRSCRRGCTKESARDIHRCLQDIAVVTRAQRNFRRGRRARRMKRKKGPKFRASALSATNLKGRRKPEERTRRWRRRRSRAPVDRGHRQRRRHHGTERSRHQACRPSFSMV